MTFLFQSVNKYKSKKVEIILCLLPPFFFVFLATIIRLYLLQDLASKTIFITYFPAIILASLIGNFFSGIITVFLSIIATNYFLIPPIYSFKVSEKSDLIGVYLFIGISLTMIIISELMHRSQKKAIDLSLKLKLEKEKLQHELLLIDKNKLIIKTENHYKALFDSMNEAFATCAVVFGENGEPVDYRFVAVNKAFEQLIGRTNKELEGVCCSEIFPTMELYWLELVKKVAVNLEPARCEEYSHRSNKYWSVYCFSPEKGQIAILFEDYTARKVIEIEQKKAEAEVKVALEKAERANKIKTDFIANFSHEIRTPMNAILGFSELLKAKISDSDQIEYMQGIIAGGKSLLCIINDILDLSKIEAGKTELKLSPCNIFDICCEISQMYATLIQEKFLSYEYTISDNVPKYLHIDEARIRQILQNLLSNAKNYTEKGYIKFIVEFSNSPQSNFGDLSFTVIDTGIGIEPDKQEIIFEPFTQLIKQHSQGIKGTGLGLTITKRLVELMQGSISIQSSLGKGSIFKVVLPNIQISPSFNFEKQTTNSTLIDFKSAKILIVDDVDSNRKLIKEYLNYNNLMLFEAENGLKCLELSKKHLPNLILLDLNMPIMDGYSAYRELRALESTKNIPIIAVTAGELHEDTYNNRSVFDDYLIKPISRNELINSIIKFLKFNHIPVNVSQNPLERKNKNSYLQNLTPELVSILQAKFLPKIDSLIKRMTIDQISQFAEMLHEFSVNNNCTGLTSYADELNEAVSTYNDELISTKLNLFKEIITDVKTTP